MPYRDVEARRQYARTWRAQRREEWLRDKTCAECESTAALQIHHREKREKVSHKIWSWTPARLVAELRKCDVLCESCHRRLHAAERRAEAVARRAHGSRQRYGLGCRCADCRRAHAFWNRIYRLTRRVALTHPPKSWIASVELDDERRTETVQTCGVVPHPEQGGTITLADGTRIILVEPAEAA